MEELSEHIRINTAGEISYRCQDCDSWETEVQYGQCASCWNLHSQTDRNDYPDGFNPELYDL